MMFAVGLVALALAGVSVIALTRDADAPARLGGLLVGAGLVTYLPQFFAAPGIRVAHGLVLGAGLVLLASALAARRGGGVALARGAVTNPIG